MLTIAIQAGGQSSRIGQDKAFTRLAGKPLIEHVITKLYGLGDELLITTNNPEKYQYLGLRTVPDRLPYTGAVIGLHSAISAASHEHVLSVACDMPFLNRNLLQHLIDLSTRADVVVPFYNGEFEPFHAVYSRKCAAAIESALAQKRMRMIGFYDQVSVHKVGDIEINSLDPAGLSFFNINTHNDLRLAEEIFEQQSE